MAFENFYQEPDSKNWQGRTDGNHPERIHQWIKLVSLKDREGFSSQEEKPISLLGFACDEGVRRNLGRLGAQGGPKAFRQGFKNLCCFFQDHQQIAFQKIC